MNALEVGRTVARRQRLALELDDLGRAASARGVEEGLDRADALFAAMGELSEHDARDALRGVLIDFERDLRRCRVLAGGLSFALANGPEDEATARGLIARALR